MPVPSSRVRCVCKACNKVFSIKRHQAERGEGIYCSVECYRTKPYLTFQDILAKYSSEPNEHGCILWTAHLRNGYPLCLVTEDGNRVYYSVHRTVYELANGPIPEGLQVRHLCDRFYPAGDQTSRRCVNPAHMTIGTHADNAADKTRAGRHHKPGYTCRRLTAEDVRAIRLLHSQGISQVQIARRFGSSVPNINMIINRKTWQHVD